MRMSPRAPGRWLAAAVLAVSSACASGPLSQLVRPPSPHDQYADALRQSGLDVTALGRDWLNAASEVVQSPSEATLPFNEVVFFAPDTPRAAAYRFELARGRQLSVTATIEGEPPARLFVDLFQVDDGGLPQHISSLDGDAAELTHDVDEGGAYVVRVQPELLRGGRVSVVTRTLAALPFPVPSSAARQVDGAFGDERDAGRRAHEGIDIFAARGTPVVAVRDGVARPGTNALGGTVVWLQDSSRGLRYYYAHLDSTAITARQRVAAGTVLGYVGNSGNARTTDPHLHFGIYAGEPIDPLPFLAADQDVPASPAPTLPLGSLARVQSRRLDLRAGGTPAAARLATLEAGTLLQVSGAVSTWIRVYLPDGTCGYVARQSVVAADTPLQRPRVPAGSVLRQRPLETAAPLGALDLAQQVDVLGRFGDYDFVRTSQGETGWLRRG
jgi:murein DD-endopeptidase MepM/ murein hydrolase activator NlpD